MSLPGSLPRSTNSPVVSSIGSLSLFALLIPALPSVNSSLRTSRRALHLPATRPSRTATTAPKLMENCFINALVKAGTCQKHARTISESSTRTLFKFTQHTPQQKPASGQEDSKGTEAPVHSEGKMEKAKHGIVHNILDRARHDLKQLVDYYAQEPKPPEEDVEGRNIDDAWDVAHRHKPWPLQQESDRTYIKKIEELLEDEESSHEEIHALYQDLPFPGVAYLHLPTIRDLMHHLSVVEEKDQASMQRYFSIMDDMRTANIKITRSEWTSAIAFAGRCMRRVSSDEVDAALYIWKEMELSANVRATRVTLNVLFDIAVKAGKYTLADTLIKELRARNLRPLRYTYVSLIHYYGLVKDGNGIRQAYQELLEAGEIVDTVVMNAVIAAMMRAGEPSAAEHVFARMKTLHTAKSPRAASPQTWRASRRLGTYLDNEASKFRNVRKSSPEKGEHKRQKLQDVVPIAPDTRTYGLLIRHHAETAGNIDRVDELLGEMQRDDIPLDGTIFIVIFYGFKKFGGVRYSSWTADRLEFFWLEYLQSVDIALRRTFFSPLAVINALKAFAKCTTPQRTLEAWEQVMAHWKPSDDEIEPVLKALKRLIPNALSAAAKTQA